VSINFNNLTEAELVDFNKWIVERLRFLHQARAHTPESLWARTLKSNGWPNRKRTTIPQHSPI
jgi:hypothetical protein